MSFSLTAPCPNDKNLFGQCCVELSDGFFDEFLTFSNENNTLDYTSLPASTYLDASTSESPSLGTSLSSTEDDIKPHPFNHNELDASPYLHLAQNQFYNNLMGRAAVSDSELLSLENITFESPQMPQYTQRTQRSLPLSQSPITAASSRRKARIADVLSQSFKEVARSLDNALIRSPIRQPACSPNMMTSPHQTHNSEAWGQKLQQDASKFDFSFNGNSDNLTPPLAYRVSDILPKLIRTPSKLSNAFVNPAGMQRSGSPIYYSTLLLKSRGQEPVGTRCAQRFVQRTAWRVKDAF